VFDINANGSRLSFFFQNQNVCLTLVVFNNVFQILKDGMNTHLLGHRTSKVVMAKDIVCTFASSQSISNGRDITKMFGVDERNIKKGVERRILLNTKKIAFWLNYRKSRRFDFLDESLRNIVIQWWIACSTISPNRKDVVKSCVGIKQYETHETHYLQMSQVKLFFLNF